jgi:hypothetical protein
MPTIGAPRDSSQAGPLRAEHVGRPAGQRATEHPAGLIDGVSRFIERGHVQDRQLAGIAVHGHIQCGAKCSPRRAIPGRAGLLARVALHRPNDAKTWSISGRAKPSRARCADRAGPIGTAAQEAPPLPRGTRAWAFTFDTRATAIATDAYLAVYCPRATFLNLALFASSAWLTMVRKLGLVVL